MTIVKTQNGSVKGYTDKGLLFFKGIPYAQPPIGDLRFKAPQSPSSWEGIRDASQVGLAAPQNKSVMALVDKTGEDCLYLNVVSPDIDQKKRPVMFWIHGGAFVTGSGEQSLYLSGNLPKDGDVVLVTINYRLGVLGFGDFSQLNISKSNEANQHSQDNFDSHSHSNNGLRDMIMALDWVQNNIESFGGDPGNITIFGESAGGMSVASLLASPLAKGLFHKAIMQSGAAHMTSLPKDSQRVAQAILQETNTSTLEELKLLNCESLLAAQDVIGNIKFTNEGRDRRLPISNFAFMPTIGDDVLPIDPLIAIEQGSAKDIPVIVGSNLHEWNFFIYLADINKEKLDKAALLKVMNTRISGYAEDALNCYYDDEELARPVDVFSAIESDRMFRLPAIRLLEAQLAHQKQCYSYLFTLESILFDGKLGSCHAAEIPCVFGSLDDDFAKVLYGKSATLNMLSSKCMQAWGNFARFGTPACESLPDWTEYDTQTRTTQELGESCPTLTDPMSEQRKFWDILL